MNDDQTPAWHDAPYRFDGIDWHKDIVLAYAKGVHDGHRVGVFDERRRIATGHAEINAVWKPIGVRGHATRVAELVAHFEQRAADSEAATWRGQYPGGPVDFETGALIQPQIRAAA